MKLVSCTICGASYPLEETPHLCHCGGIWDFSDFPQYSKPSIHQIHKGLWRYQTCLGLPYQAPVITLGEGGTPLLAGSINGFSTYYKLESQNPTGSYKDRGSAVLVSFLASRGINEVVEDSSGNAGASLAAYCARAGVSARVFIPESASGPKRWQIEQYGAKVESIPGPRANAAAAVLEAVHAGSVYASHAYMPFGLAGIATIAYELVEDLGKVPGTILAPVGHGGLLYGILLGFEALLAEGVTDRMPRFIGVQAEACSPAVAAYTRRINEIPEIQSSETLAEGASVIHPVRAVPILKRLYAGNGIMVSVSEPQLREAYKRIARQGIFCEPTACLSLAALLSDKIEVEEPVVAIVTGSGLKTNSIL